MKRILAVVFSRWVLGIVGLAALAVLIWWVGPEISISGFAPFEAEWVRWLHIGLIALVPLVRWILRVIRVRRANAILMTGLLTPVASKAQSAFDPSAEEVAQLRQRFEAALGLLRKLRFGTDRPSLWARIRSVGSRQHLYELPWYVFIGAPGAGKTTALVNSGLRFPLADRLGREAVRGVGGTRNCDWWFTDEAVFIDTAGRYTTQDSSRDVDAGAWKGFLHLLKKSRPRRPINGVLVTVSVGDLVQLSPAEQETQAEAVRNRIRELSDELTVHFPVYLLVTKSDLLAGFTEFFGQLGKEEREQVWGFSLPLGERGPDLAGMSTELDRLERRLYERLPERLEEERDPARRTLLYGFPQQFALLRERLVHFVETAFGATRLATSPMLRGVHFTSGTQEGSPIDRVMGRLGRHFGLERTMLPPQHATGRSYFLTRLLRDVIFPEAGLAGLDVRGERRHQWIRAGVIAGSAAAVVVVAVGWWISYSRNHSYLEEVTAQLTEVKKHVAPVQAGAVSDLSELLPSLTSVRTLAETRATPDGSVPWSWRLGLYQGAKLEAASRAAYNRMLQATLLPSLTSHLDQHLRRLSPDNREDVYEALKTYLMLYDAKHFKREAVWSWYETRVDQLVPASQPDAAREFRAHFEALYERGWVDPPVPRNDALVAQLRALIAREPLANRIYDRLKREPVTGVRDFTVLDKAGSKAMLVFERASGEPLTKGVAAFYTKDVYYKHFAKRADAAAAELAQEEPWVLGTGAGGVGGLVSSPKIAEAVKRLYLEDYRQTWRRFISDIAVIKSRDLARIIEVTRAISAPDGPLKPLVKAIEREVSLSVPPEGEAGLAGTISSRAQNIAGKARQAVVGAAPGSLEKELVDDHFDDVRKFATPPGGGTGPGPVDATIQQLDGFYHMLVAAKAALDTAQAPPTPEAANKLRADAARLPEPVRTMVQGLVETGTRQVLEKVRNRQEEEKRQAQAKEAEEKRQAQAKEVEVKRLVTERQEKEANQIVEKRMTDLKEARKRIDAEIRTQIADFCVKAVSGRYPFVRAGTQDVPPDDFSRLFSPGGVLDTVFQKHIAAYVDTSDKPWRFRDPAVMGQSAALVEFQRAHAIREVFFRGGGTTPSFQLEFRPHEMDASIQQFVLDVDGKLVRYAHGPPLPTRVQFPGPGGRSQVRVTVSPPSTAGATGMKFDGPWALFRMFDEVSIVPTAQAERFLTTFTIGNRRAVFDVFATSVRNPFRLPELTEFRCPTAL